MVRTGSLDRCKRVLYLNERLFCNRFLLVIRHQNDTSFHDLYSDMLSGIKPRRAQLLARKDDFQRRFVEKFGQYPIINERSVPDWSVSG